MNLEQRRIVRWTLNLFGLGFLLWFLGGSGRMFANTEGLPIGVVLIAAAKFVWAGRGNKS